jgi:hypothetical protein
MSRVHAALKKAEYQALDPLIKPIPRPTPRPIHIQETVGLWDRFLRWMGAERLVASTNHKGLRKQTIRSTSR